MNQLFSVDVVGWNEEENRRHCSIPKILVLLPIMEFAEIAAGRFAGAAVDFDLEEECW